MNIHPILISLWRKLPVSYERKMILRNWLLHRWPHLQPTKVAVVPDSASISNEVITPPDVAKVVAGPNLDLILSRTTAYGKRDWLIFGIIGWNFRIQRPQHLARELAAAGETVFYIDSDFIAHDSPGYALHQIDPDLPLYSVRLHLKGAPLIYFKAPEADQLSQLQQSISCFIQQWGVHAAKALLQHPYWVPLAWSLPNTLQIYDCMDHHEGFGGMPQDLLDLEHKYIKNCDSVIVTSKWLQDWTQSINRKSSIVRNGCDYIHFSSIVKNPFISKNKRNIIGYFGAIAEWFDISLIEKIAYNFPDCDIILIGNDTINAEKKLSSFSNVFFLGEKPYSTLPYYLHGFDVCLLPFLRIPLTLATNPVKVYEYLCAGSEVVCTNLPEISQFGNLVHSAENHNSFIECIRFALNSPANAKTKEDRRLFAKTQTWKNRADELILESNKGNYPSISVIVLTYNNWSYTKDCLESLFIRTDYPGKLEVIVSDNASTDETVDRLKEWATREPRMHLVLNSENLGFSAGNNRGLHVATGDYLVLLNNDTVVTRGWALNMLRHFQNDPELGLLGPATNHIGNESKVPVSYESLKEMPSISRAWTLKHMGQLYPMRTLAFFCVMMPRKIYEQVGPMDEKFGRGFFEDDDYSRRVEKAGFKLACADDVFIHHRLSASFEKLDNSEKNELFLKNKSYYESKWGEWVPHSYRNF